MVRLTELERVRIDAFWPLLVAAANAHGLRGEKFTWWLGILGHESGFSPWAVNVDAPGLGEDVGIAQLNTRYYPHVGLDENPAWALGVSAGIFAGHLATCPTIEQAVAAYNLGHCGSDPGYVAAVRQWAEAIAEAHHLPPPAGAPAASGPGAEPAGSFWAALHRDAWVLLPFGILFVFVGIRALLLEV